MDTKPNRIPAADSAEFSHWRLPEMTAGHIVPAATDAARRSQAQQVTPQQAVKAAELERISEEAYRAGYREGLETGHAEGRAEGFDQGRGEGLAAARQETDAVVARFSNLCEQLLQPLDAQRAALQCSLTELALELARKVIGRDPITSADQVTAVVEQALAALPAGAEGIDVFLHPADLELLEQSGRHRPEWRLSDDPELQPGDVRLRTRHSVVDFTRESRFQQLLAALLEDRPGFAPDDPQPAPEEIVQATAGRASAPEGNPQ